MKFKAADGLETLGFLAVPNKKTKKAIIHVHGMQDHLWSPEFLEQIARAAVKNNFAFFTCQKSTYYMQKTKDHSVKGLVLIAPAGMRLPILAIFGSKEKYLSVSPEMALKMLQSASASCTTALISHANHNFKGHEKQLTTEIDSWLEKLKI